MWKKILWWIKNRPDKPLSYSLTVAAVVAEKANPEDFCREFLFKGRDNFISDCQNKNQIFDSDDKVKTEFKNETGVSIDELIDSEILMEIILMDNVNDFISSKTFDSQEEIKHLCNRIYYDFLNEKCFLNPLKNIGNIYGQRGIAFVTQMQNLGRGVDNRDRWAEGTANQFWFGNNAISCITKKMNELLIVDQTDELYRDSVLKLIDAFGFSMLQIEMLKYFVCQSRDGDCPSHRNKGLFFWGETKGVGKTTIASTIVSILNGEKDINNIRKYKSSLAQELQYVQHIAPLICSARAVLLDEAIPHDSSKSYGNLKDRMTSDGAKVRFVFKNQIDVKAKPNYVFISNDPLEYFIQDKSERRFFEFRIEEKRKKLSYDEIYNLFLKFIQQCKREKDWLEWSDFMATDTEVKGIESRNIEDVRSFFEMEGFFYVIDKGSDKVSIGTFYKWVHDIDKSASKKTIRECIESMFGDPIRPSTWKKSDIISVLSGEENKEKEIPF